MRTRKKDKQNLVKVGAFLSALTLVLMIMVASIGKENSLFDSKVLVKARVSNVSNLKPGSYVELKGIQVGAVKSIEIVSEDQVEVVFSMLEKELEWVRKDTTVVISNAGLVGDKFLEIKGGSREGGRFNPNQDILYSEAASGFAAIMSKGENIADVTTRILTKVDNLLTNMEDGKKIIDTMNSINRASMNLEAITNELKEAHLGKMVKNVNMSMANLNGAAGSMERIMSRIEKGPGTMNSMIYDDSLHEELRGLLGGAQRNKVIKYFIRESIKKAEKKP
jgi:phospholipid/cholesterol/gamma-HCH transport system substrate-binding protein